jgi:hypothetical protein
MVAGTLIWGLVSLNPFLSSHNSSLGMCDAFMAGYREFSGLAPCRSLMCRSPDIAIVLAVRLVGSFSLVCHDVRRFLSLSSYWVARCSDPDLS